MYLACVFCVLFGIAKLNDASSNGTNFEVGRAIICESLLNSIVLFVLQNNDKDIFYLPFSIIDINKNRQNLVELLYKILPQQIVPLKGYS